MVGCPHLSLVLKIDKEKLLVRAESACNDCRKKEKLWGCLKEECSFNGCGESINDHSTKHYKKSRHAVAVNLTSFRIWCYACEAEVHLPAQFTPAEMKLLRKAKKQKTSQSGPEATRSSENQNASSYQPESVSMDPRGAYNEMQIPPGLIGLRNMGNTCYMNAALQAMSNCVPLTKYFLYEWDHSQVDKTPSMAKHYFRLVHDMWNQQQHSCVAPTGVHNTLKSINPSFRGYHQQDAQEFLRCFMDRLHEELKYLIPKWTYDQSSIDNHQDEKNSDMGTTSSTSSIQSSTSSDSFTIVSESDSATQQSTGNVPNISAATLQDRTSENDNEFNGMNWRPRTTDGHYRPNRTKIKYHNERKKSVEKPVHRYRSIVSEIFDGELRSSVQCLTCDQVSHKRETFQDLSLPIPGKDDLARLHGTTVGLYKTSGIGSLAVVPGFKGPCNDSNISVGYVYNTVWNVWEWVKSWFWGPQVTLNDCLSAFFSADELKGDNMYSCEKCNKLRNGVKYCKVLQLPEVLCIHLKRFRHEYLTSYSSKISSPVSFPISGLDLRKYLAQDTPSTCTSYDLCSVIVHLGNAGGGHYTSYAKNIVDNNWYEFDDQFISPVSESIVANAEAYVLFYCKSSREASRARERIVQIGSNQMETDGNSDLLQFHVSTRWLNKFLNFTEPGPIDNSDFVCRHLGVIPSAAQDINNLQSSISETLWREFHGRFGGGPAVTSLQICHTCEEEEIAVQERRENEKKMFLQLSQSTGETESSASMYISLEWFREWEDFLNGKLPEPPGMIDNRPICYAKEGKYLLRKSSSHAPIHKTAWEYLISIYGGGPEVAPKIRTTSSTNPTRAVQDPVQQTRSTSPPPSTPPIVDPAQTEYMEIDRVENNIEDKNVPEVSNNPVLDNSETSQTDTKLPDSEQNANEI